MITVQGLVDRTDGYVYFTFYEYFPVVGYRTLRGHVDRSTGKLMVWDDRDYVAGWPCWREANVDRSSGEIELELPRYVSESSHYYGVYRGFASHGDGGSTNYAQVQADAYTDFLAATGRVNEDAFKHGDTNGLVGTCRCWFRSGYKSYTRNPYAGSDWSNVLDAKLEVAGKHYYRIYDGGPTMGRVDAGQVTFDWNEGPYNMYSSGQDFVSSHVADATVTAQQFNDTWAASAAAWDASPADDSYRTIDIPPSFFAGMSGSEIYIWFMLTNTTFPWRDDTDGTAEDLGIFYGDLWVLR